MSVIKRLIDKLFRRVLCTNEEFGRFMSHLAKTINSNVVEIIETADKDGDGYVDLYEGVEMVRGLYAVLTKAVKELRKSIREADNDRRR